MGNIGEQVTLQKSLSAANLEPGIYKIEIKVNEQHLQADRGSDGNLCRGVKWSGLTPEVVVMFRKISSLVVIFGLALPALAADKPGSISGYVRNGAGVAQMGAMVEILGSAARDLKVFTDVRGYYSIASLHSPVPTASKSPRLPFCPPARTYRSACRRHHGR